MYAIFFQLKMNCFIRKFFPALVAIVCVLNASFAQDFKNASLNFEKNCASCHNFIQDGIGPHLGGLATSLTPKYMMDFIKNPQKMIQNKDSRALQQYQKFKLIMPSFAHLSPKELSEIVAYIRSKPAPTLVKTKEGAILENPIPEAIPMGNIAVNLKKIRQFPATSANPPLARINKMGIHPITKESMVLDLQGKIYIINQAGELETFFDATENLKTFINNPGLATGLGSFAFHPDFKENGLFYTTHTEPASSKIPDFFYADSIRVKMQWVVDEWKLEDKLARKVSGLSRELLRLNVVTQIHGMQEIAFNPYAKKGDEEYGLMYIGIGDGGAVENKYPFIARNRNTIWGKVLRINPLGNDSKNKQYGIPTTNPYVGKQTIGEVYAQGFRNPNRISWLKDGRKIVSNIGHNQIESLYLLEAARNYGWPDREGTFVIDTTANLRALSLRTASDKEFDYTYPIAQFDHDEGNAIMGGFEYIGKNIPSLKGKYIFGEIVRGRVFYINISDINAEKPCQIYEMELKLDGKAIKLPEMLKTGKVDLRLGQDAFGEVYLFTKYDGMMYLLTE